MQLGKDDAKPCQKKGGIDRFFWVDFLFICRPWTHLDRCSTLWNLRKGVILLCVCLLSLRFNLFADKLQETKLAERLLKDAHKAELRQQKLKNKEV